MTSRLSDLPLARGVQTASPELAPDMGPRERIGLALASKEISIQVGDQTLSGRDLAGMSDGQLHGLCQAAGLDTGDVLQLLDDVAVSAEAGQTINLTADAPALANLADGIDGNYAQAPRWNPSSTDVTTVLSQGGAASTLEGIETLGWFDQILRFFADIIAEMFGDDDSSDTYTFNDRGAPSRAALEVVREQSESFAAIFAMPQGVDQLRAQMLALRPGDDDWTAAVDEMIPLMQAEATVGTEHLRQLHGNAQVGLQGATPDEVGALETALSSAYAAHAGNDEGRQALEGLVSSQVFTSLELSVSERTQLLSAFTAMAGTQQAMMICQSVASLTPDARTEAIGALRTGDAAVLSAMSDLIDSDDFQSLGDSAQGRVLDVCARANFDPGFVQVVTEAATTDGFRSLGPNVQVRVLSVLGEAAGQPGTLRALAGALGSSRFAALAPAGQLAALTEAEGALTDEAQLDQFVESMSMHGDLSLSDVGRMGGVISKSRLAAIVRQHELRGLSYTFTNADGETYRFVTDGPTDRAAGIINLGDIVDARRPAQRLAQLTSGIDPNDLFTLMRFVADDTAAQSVQIDLNAELGQAFGVDDGRDGTAISTFRTALTRELMSPDTMFAFADRMENHDISLRYEGQDITAADLRGIFASPDPEAVFNERWPNVDYDNFRRFVGDLSTVVGADLEMGEDWLGECTFDLTGDNLQELGLGGGEYRSVRTERMLQQALGTSLELNRCMLFGGVLASPAQDRPSIDETVAAQGGGSFNAGASVGRSSIFDRGGYYTTELVALIEQNQGDLGAALGGLQDFMLEDDSQLAMLSGDVGGLSGDQERTRVTLFCMGRFPRSTMPSAYRDGQVLANALTGDPPRGVGLDDDQVRTVRDQGALQAHAVAKRAILTTPAGGDCFFYFASHGNEEEITCADGEPIDAAMIEEWRRLAAMRGVELHIMSDSCQSAGLAAGLTTSRAVAQVTAATGHPHLEDVYLLSQGLEGLMMAFTEIIDDHNYRPKLFKNLPREMRVFSDTEFPDWFGRAMTKERGPDGHYSPGPTLVEMLASDPQTAPRLARLDAEVAQIRARPESEWSEQDQLVVRYREALTTVSTFAEDFEARQTILLNQQVDAAAGNGTPLEPHLVSFINDPYLMGTLGTDDSRAILDRDDPCRELLYVLDKGSRALNEVLRLGGAGH